MRPSKYIVSSDTSFVSEGGVPVRVVLHSSSGQVYVLSTQVLDTMLNSPSDLSQAEKEELTAAGLLVNDDRDEFAEVIAENSAQIRANKTRLFVLMPSAFCNMGCGYCGQAHFRLPKADQHREEIKKRIAMAARHPETHGISISWFGAEPMMGYAQILDISRTVIAICDEVGIPFSSKMVTNGTLLTLDKLRTLHHDARVNAIEITLDGAGKLHDSQRPLKSGRSSFSRILATLKTACDDDSLTGLMFSIRTNISRANQDDHESFAATMATAGLAHPRISYYPTVVREWSNDVSAFAVDPKKIVTIERNWLEAYRKYGLNGDNLPIIRKHQVCVAVNQRTEVIAPTGEIHSCTEQPLVPSRAGTHVGHVAALQTPKIRPRGQFDDWNTKLLGPTPAFCPSCAIFPICGGQCPMKWLEGTPACPSIKTTMPMRLSRYGVALGLAATP